MSIESGTHLGPYIIRYQIGVGGMGEVYYAVDTRLGRSVAIKILREDITSDEERLRRFKQEAYATSALNHPNILTIYDIGRDSGVNYIVSEFIDGITLRQHMKRTAMQPGEAANIALQITTGLHAAHSKGIVHRDIKPENIMLREDGYVKILDFGLAKLSDTVNFETSSSEAATAPYVDTESGVILGTIAYMSPEQLRAQNLDGRSDLWSVGVILYEMLTGVPPFGQVSKTALIVSILEEDPPPLPQSDLNVSTEIQRIVSRALRKDVNERYQNASELREELVLITQSSGSTTEAHLAFALANSKVMGTRTVAPDPDEPGRTIKISRPIEKAIVTNAGQYLPGGIRRHFKGLLLLLITAAVALGALSQYWRSEKIEQQIQSKILVTAGRVLAASISPDARDIVMLVIDGDKQSVSLKRIATSAELELLPPAQATYRGLTFSPDGNYVYYLRQDQDQWNLFRVAALGGTPRKLIERVDTPVTFSPSGQQLAFLRKKDGASMLFVANEDGGEQKELATGEGPHQFSANRDLDNAPAWSPDGRTIACPVDRDDSGMEMIAVRVDDGLVTPITVEPFFLIGQLSWLPGGRGLIFNAKERASSESALQLWLVDYPGGKTRRITNDLNYYRQLSLSREGKVLLSTRKNQISSMWLIPDGDFSRIEQIALSQGKGTGGISWTTDNKILYASAERGSQDIWEMESNGSRIKQLTFDQTQECEPVQTRDQNTIVYVSYAGSESHIWRMEADGSGQKQLTDGAYEDWPQVSPDGRFIVFRSENSGVDSIWRIDIDGHNQVRLSDRPAKHPVISPDGNWIACYSKKNLQNSPWELTIIPFSGDGVARSFPLPGTVSDLWHGPRWMPDGNAIVYIVTTAGRSDLWKQPKSGEKPERLTNFKENQIDAFAWSPDGKYLACVRTATITEIVLMENSSGWH
jgi:eukaryotic-like serine/threonine-protein kinase